LGMDESAHNICVVCKKHHYAFNNVNLLHGVENAFYVYLF
jgi:hypothetical protein